MSAGYIHSWTEEPKFTNQGDVNSLVFFPRVKNRFSFTYVGEQEIAIGYREEKYLLCASGVVINVPFDRDLEEKERNRIRELLSGKKPRGYTSGSSGSSLGRKFQNIKHVSHTELAHKCTYFFDQKKNRVLTARDAQQFYAEWQQCYGKTTVFLYDAYCGSKEICFFGLPDYFTSRLDNGKCTLNPSTIKKVKGFGTFDPESEMGDVARCADCSELPDSVWAWFSHHIKGTTYLCMSCLIKKDKRERLGTVYKYHQGPKPPMNYVAGVRDTQLPIVMGVELELETKGDQNVQDTAEDIMTLLDSVDIWAKAENDSSLHHGVEIITAPMQYDTLRKALLKLAHDENNIHSDVRHFVGDDFTPWHAGLHLHVSHISNTEAMFLQRILVKEPTVMYKLAQRQQSSFAVYPNDYNRVYDGHYDALSYKGDGHFELRVFRGQTTWLGVVTCLEVLHSMIMWARELSVNKAGETLTKAPEKVRVKYETWVKRHKEAYPHAYQRMTGEYDVCVNCSEDDQTQYGDDSYDEDAA